MSIGERLRQSIRKSNATLYRIAKDTEIDWGTLQRFMDGTRPNIRIDTVEKLCAHFGLELRPTAANRRAGPTGQSRSRR